MSGCGLELRLARGETNLSKNLETSNLKQSGNAPFRAKTNPSPLLLGTFPWRILLSHPGRDWETSAPVCFKGPIWILGMKMRQIGRPKKTKKNETLRTAAPSCAVLFLLAGFSSLSTLSLSLTPFLFPLSFPSPPPPTPGPRRPQRPARQGPQHHGRHPHPRRDPHAQVPRRQRRQGAADLAPGPPQGRPRGQVPPQPRRPSPAGAAQGHQGLQGRRLHRRQGLRGGQGARQRLVFKVFFLFERGNEKKKTKTKTLTFPSFFPLPTTSPTN